MKLSTIQTMILSRKNVIAFLHMSDITKLNILLSTDVAKMSFNEISAIIIAKYKNKEISNKKMCTCIAIILQNNDHVKKERYHFDGYTIYEYDAENCAYLFVKEGTYKEYTQLMSKNGEYV